MGRIVSIAATASFVDVLAARLLAAAGRDGLARWTVLLPNRRAGRALTEAFVRLSDGTPLLLPRLAALGDLDADEPDGWLDSAADLPPEIPPLVRRFALARLVGAFRTQIGQPVDAEYATALADALARLLDQFQTEGVSLDRLPDLVPADHAGHWHATLALMRILAEHWPRELARLGALDPADRRDRHLRARAELWRREPPADPIVVAGSTGSIPAAAELIAVVAHLPQGEVVLPGLDPLLGPEDWDAVRADTAHPQAGLIRLLDRLQCPPDQVEDLGRAPELGPRAKLISLSLLPAQRTEIWRGEPLGATVSDALSGVSVVETATAGEEAAVIALALREALEVPARTACLITPDRAIARRVAAELQRYQIDIDDSAGVPLDQTPVGSFLTHLAMVAGGTIAAVPMLALLKHPLAAFGWAPARVRGAARLLERVVLRGPRLTGSFAAWRAALAEPRAKHDRRSASDIRTVTELLAHIETVLAPLLALSDQPIDQAFTVLIAVAEAVAATDTQPGPTLLWQGEAGDAAHQLLSDLVAIGDQPLGFDDLPPGDLAALWRYLAAGVSVRPRWGRHPRLAILGPIEARLQHADLVILAGLNEGTWPAPAPVDPWLGRGLRAAVGLPSLDRRIGQAAHDVEQLLAARHVMLTRATKVDGTPTVPSRWLQRLDAAVTALGGTLPRDPRWAGWAAALDAPIGARTAMDRPQPRPPVKSRPRRLSVTRIETLMRDPYEIYARSILRLEALQAIDADADPALKGVLMHRVLERFTLEHPSALPANALAELARIAADVFQAIRHRPELYAFWWPEVQRSLPELVSWEAESRQAGVQLHAEVPGSWTFDSPGGPFILTAEADRIEVGPEGIAIVDYKTGTPPKEDLVHHGFAPQLPLEAVIAAAGGFQGIPALGVHRLEFWKLGPDDKGRRRAVPKATKDNPYDAALAETIATAAEGVRRIIAAFDDPATPYLAQPRRDTKPRYSDYQHLQRAAEWATEDE